MKSREGILLSDLSSVKTVDALRTEEIESRLADEIVEKFGLFADVVGAALNVHP